MKTFLISGFIWILAAAFEYKYRFTDEIATDKYTYSCYPA